MTEEARKGDSHPCAGKCAHVACMGERAAPALCAAGGGQEAKARAVSGYDCHRAVLPPLFRRA